MKRLVLVAFVLTGACSSRSIPSDGYGVIKFGMSAAQLQQAGLTCSSESQCSADSFIAMPNNNVPFAKADRATANLTDGKVSSIDAMFLMYTDDEMIAAYEKAFGDAEVCRHQNMVAATVERHYWTASNGATVTVSKILDYGAAPNLSGLTGGRGTSATYRDPEESKRFASKTC